MSNSGKNVSGGPDLDLDQPDDLPIKIVHARKAIPISDIYDSFMKSPTENTTKHWTPSKPIAQQETNSVKTLANNDQDSGKGSPFRYSGTTSSAFRSIDSPFKIPTTKTEKGFSATPGPWHKKQGKLVTPTKGYSSAINNNPETPDQYNMFKTDDGWSNVRKAAAINLNNYSSPAGGLLPSSMSPLMASMVNQVVEQNSPATSSHTRKSFDSTHNSAYIGDTVETARGAESEDVELAAVEIDADLDIRNVAKDLEATRFHGSLVNTRAYDHAAGSLKNPAELNTTTADIRRSRDNLAVNPFSIGRTLFEDSDFTNTNPKEDSYWIGNSSILLQQHHDSSIGSSNKDPYGFASRSYPQYSNYSHTAELDYSNNSHLLGNESSDFFHTHVANNDHSFGLNRSDVSVTASRMEQNFDPNYPVEHSFPAYHGRIGAVIPGSGFNPRSGGHNQEETGTALAMKNNWMAHSASENTESVYSHNHTAAAASDPVEDYSEVTSQLSHQFLHMHHSRANKSCPPGLAVSSLKDASGPLGSYPENRHELPLGMPSASGINPSAPTFQPQSEIGRVYGLPQNTAGSTYSAPSQTAAYMHTDYGLPSDQAPSFRPPQQTLYEPSLPPSAGSLRGAPKHHRLSRSDGSFDPRSSGGGGVDRARLHLDNNSNRLRGSGSYLPGTNSLQSSIDSETSLSSRFHPPQQQQSYQQHQQQQGAHINNSKSFENMPSQRHGNINNPHIPLTLNTLPVRVSKEAGKFPFMRPDILESPRSKNAYKEFYREFRLKEKESEESAREFALKTISTVPENCKTRIYLELADICKRYNKIEEARGYYAEVCRAQPKANMGWLEWSKMEEENGNLRRALDILILGLKVCASNEAILTKVIKLQERLHRYEEVRGLLGKLRYESIEKVWKSVLEGSLFEARTGNIRISRKLFKYLMHLVPWYGPIYSEAYQLEEKEYNDKGALDIIQKGLKELPRYGPLWFGLFRIMERQDVKAEYHHWQRGVKPQLDNIKRETNNAVRSISKELTWKVHMECSQAEERSAEIAALGMHHASGLSYTYCLNILLEDARKSLVRSLLSCPANLRWRVFLSGARLELSVGEVSKARGLLQRSLREVPPKSKVYVYLECSRVEEYLGNLDMVRLLLGKARQEFGREWKVYLEVVLVEARAGMMERAVKLAREALKYHSGSGRLWALYIHLCHRLEMKYFNITEKNMIEQRLGLTSTSTASIDCDKMWLSKERVLRRAIAEVPKSGEVWCERGRCQLNPLSMHCFDLSLAQQSLSFATQFTPQYGDTFIEYVRLEMLCQVLLPRVLMALQVPVLPFLSKYLSQDPESDLVELLRSQWGSQEFGGEDSKAPTLTEADRCKRRQTILAIVRMRYDAGDLIQQYRDVSIKNLNRRCVNADPNYGTTWFHCRAQPYDIPTTVLHSALDRLVHELTDTQKIYSCAILHFVRRCLRPSCVQSINELSTGAVSSSPVRSISAPACRNRSDKSETTRSLNLPAGGLSHPTTSVVAQGSAINTSASMSGSVPVPLDLTMLGGRKSPMRPNSRQQGIESEHSTTAELGEQELWVDMSLVSEELTATQSFDTVHLVPFVEIDSGAVFCSADFVTGMIEMNRILFDSSLSNDIRRKLLFGSDHIVS